MNCPIDTPIPEVISLFKEGKIHEAGEVLFENNPLSAICAVVCPHEDQCKGNCIRGIKSEPVRFCEMEEFISSEYLDKIHFENLPKNKHSVAIIGGGPAGITLAFILARKGFKVTLFDAHVNLLRTQTEAMSAALAGVDVRLMLPYRADNRLTHLGSCSYLAEALRAGVKVYFYKKGFLHSKLMVSDDELSTVGSTNVDFRSFEHNFEVNAFIYDTETALQMREIFLQDQRECVQVFSKNWEKRPWHRKAAESIVRLLAPLL